MRSPAFFDFGSAAARAFRIRSCAHDRRHGRRTPDVLQRSCCRPRSRGAAGRHPLRCADAPASRCGPPGADGDGRISADRRWDDLHANGKSADVLRRRGRRGAGQSAACQNCARRHAAGRESRSPRSSRFCHGFESPRSRPRSDGHQNSCAGRDRVAPARELLVTAKFSLGPITTGTIAIARRPGAEGPIAARTVAVFAKTFAARRIGPLLAATFSRGIGLPVAKFPVGRTSSRACIVAITARRTVVAIEIRTVAARLERTLLAAAIIARTKILTRSTVRTITCGTILAVETSRTITGVAVAIAGKRPIAARARRTIIAIALAGVRFSAAGVRLLAERLGALGFPGIGTPLAVAFTLAGKPALGEFLLRPPRRPGAAFATAALRAALAAARPVAPAAGIVVFVAVAGHEWSLGYG